MNASPVLQSGVSVSGRLLPSLVKQPLTKSGTFPEKSLTGKEGQSRAKLKTAAADETCDRRKSIVSKKKKTIT